MKSFIHVGKWTRAQCDNHTERRATLIQYEDIVPVGTLFHRDENGIAIDGLTGKPIRTVRECVGAFCSEACAELDSGMVARFEAERARQELIRRHGPDMATLNVRIHPDAHLGAEEKE